MSESKSDTKNVLRATRPNESASLSAIAKRSGVNEAKARLILEVLSDVGQVARVGQKSTGKRGRPAFLYRRVSA